VSPEKRIEPVQGTSFDGAQFSGYEMHMGATEGPDHGQPFARLADGSPEGAMSSDGQIIGTYVHGLFADDRQRAAWLTRFAAAPSRISYQSLVDDILDRLAAHLEAHVDVDALLNISR
jgi:adenosylcobyric acid synthase